MNEQPTSNTFCHRPGIKGFPAFGGVDRRSDPGSITPNRFYKLENVRLVGPEIVSRGGLDPLNPDNPLAGGVLGVFDAEEPNQEPKIYFGTDGNVSAYNANQVPVTQAAMTAATAPTTTSVPIGVFNNRVLIADTSGTTAQFFSFRFFSGRGLAVDIDHPATLEFSYTDSSVGTYDFLTGSEAKQLNANYFLMRRGSVSNVGQVFKYNGSTLAVDDSVSGYYFATSGPLKFAELDGDLYYHVKDQSVNTWRVRKRDRTDGTWSTVCTDSTDAPNLADSGSGNMVGFNGTLYTMTNSGDDAVFHTIGAGGYTLVHTISAGGNIITVADACVFDDYYYFLYRQDSEMRIGRYDGSTWTDNYATTPAAALADDIDQHRLFVAGQSLWIILGKESDSSVSLYKSAGTDTTSWTTAIANTTAYPHKFIHPALVI